jgi:LPS-assembly lipoprotein
MTHPVSTALRACMHRRLLLSTLLGAGLCTVATGCGFALRRTPELPFERIALVGFAPRSTLAAELRRALAQGATVMTEPRQAEVVLEALTDLREKSVVASTAAGQVREVELRVRLVFRLSTRGGKPLLAPDEILLRRDMSYSETLALAKELEEIELYRAMESDIVSQIMRRLAQVQT